MSRMTPSGFNHDLAPEQLQALRQGSRAALASAYDQFSRPVYGLALRTLGNTHDAADVVQNVFIKLPKAAAQFRGEAPFGLWLRRLAANATIDLLRERSRLVALSDAHDELAHDSPTTDTIEADELLGRLSPTARLVLLLHAVEGYTHTEMAALFNQSESYSKSILSRALKRLRGRLASRSDDTHDHPATPD